VSIQERGDAIRIAVRDRGPGIPAEFQSLIFEKFAQVDATNTRQKGGTGLGLSIVKQAMMRMGGRVGFDAAPSGGTIVHIEVPRWNADLIVERTPQPSGDAQVIRLQPEDERLRGLGTFRRA
jgi:signal transduction histidine kinase